MTDKKKMEILSLEQRIEVIKASASGLSHRQLAAQFKCGRTQIGKILKQKDEIQKEWEFNKNRGMKRKRSEVYADVNCLVLEWLKEASAQGLPISGPVLQGKALEIAQTLQISSFSASNGWLESFRKRYNIMYRGGKIKDGCACLQQTNEWVSIIPTIVKEYDLKDVFNMDETGLFFRGTPNHSLTGDSTKCIGGKLPKERFTVALCCNAIGEKEIPLIIGNTLHPDCFQGVDISELGVHWRANEKAWMTASLFLEWLEQLNKKMKTQNRNIILFLDNASCHPPEEHFTNVRLIFLPSESSDLQPLRQGIIHCLKLVYTKKLLHSYAAKNDNCEGTQEGVQALADSITVLDAIKWLKTSWEEVETGTIQKSFALCGIKHSAINLDLLNENPEIKALENEIEKLKNVMNINEVIKENSCVEGEDYLENISSPERNLTSESDMEDCDTPKKIEPLPLNQTLTTIARLKETLHELDPENNHPKAFESLCLFEQEMKDIFIKKG